MHIFITVLILIFMLGILIGCHEAGHLAVAKAYNVYCLEYSIGFGPKIFSHTRKGGETAFSLRALPLGGYVSMYSEGVELPFGKSVPKERCLEGVSHPKRAAIMGAGIMVNLFLAFFFTMIYATCFPSYYTAAYFDTGLTNEATFVTSSDQNTETAQALSFWVGGSLGGSKIDSDHTKLYVPFTAKDRNGNEIGYVVDDAATINGSSYCAVFQFASIVSDNPLASQITFYAPDTGAFTNAYQTALGISQFPDTEKAYVLEEGDEVELHLTFIASDGYDVSPSREQFHSALGNKTTVRYTYVKNDKGNLALTSSDAVSILTYTYWAPFGQRLKQGCQYFTNFFTSIGLGLKSIFTFNFSNVGSVVAMGSVLATTSTEIGWGRTFFLYGGFLSLNLAILNLLPFPGLDGWQLLVTFLEGAFHKKINDRVKNIVSTIGIGLLLVFGVMIIIKDIVGLFIR